MVDARRPQLFENLAGAGPAGDVHTSDELDDVHTSAIADVHTWERIPHGLVVAVYAADKASHHDAHARRFLLTVDDEQHEAWKRYAATRAEYHAREATTYYATSAVAFLRWVLS